ncbi:DUF4350 domain-containing protein [Aquimarina hainanensis]|uniref:DUF4350 domain-containing protein n=1 Tax=Aquimarina hainanensis TaxID=1578017 RepID=A0ABW5N3F3_9FLAO|nr:DUF4350 domain-containing protein [Aquimarina sp. TRL1]QKX06055.1 DUF4350 domain-containing protein [Aquimarina sp. TRL1]
MRNKKTNILLVVLILILGLLIYVETSKPIPVNWSPSYSKIDKIPLGSYVSHRLIKASLDDSILKDINQPPYEYLTDNPNQEGSYVFINNHIDFDKSEMNQLLAWVAKGNTLFISANTIEKKLLDTLLIKTDQETSYDQVTIHPLVALVNPMLKKESPFLYDRNNYTRYFSAIDTTHATVLGVTQIYRDSLLIDQPKFNYIKHSFYKGNIFLHTFPEAFGNYFMLKDGNYHYTQNLFSYIDAQKPILWDHYYKAGKIFNTSPLYILLNNKHLKWSYYFILIGGVLFIIFEGKRKQRSIPIIPPLKNQTIAFTRTISGMYFEKRKHREIGNKQILLFMDYIRNQLRIPTDSITEQTLSDIAARSNNELDDTKNLFTYFNGFKEKTVVTPDDLIELNRLITNFKAK